MLVSHLKNLVFEFSKLDFYLLSLNHIRLRHRNLGPFRATRLPIHDTFYTTNTIPFPTRMIPLLPIAVDICSTNAFCIYNRDKLNFKQIMCRRQMRACLSEVSRFSMTSTKLLHFENKALDFLLLVTNLLNTFYVQV